MDSLSVDKTYHMMDIETNPSCLLQIRFIYPVDFSDKEVLNSVQKQFISDYFGDDYVDLTPEKAAEKYAENYIKTFKEMERDFQLELENHPSEPDESWYINDEILNDQIVYNQNDILSYVVYKEFFKGGAAHGAHHYTNRVINLKTGLKITESDIFIDNYQEDLTEIIIDGITLSNNVDEAVDLENIGFFNINEIAPNKNFYIDEIGITYTFNEYEIATYVVGATSVQIPYEKIRHLLRKESPIAAIAF
jgi:hypothetical protein